MKHDQIFHELKQKITTGVLAPGMKLPTEFELAAQYSVARGTVRNSLEQLEKEGLLERVKSKGTFVRQKKLTSDEKVISFLIPFPDFMRKEVHDQVFSEFANTFYGAVRAASEDGWRVQTIPFSKTNDNTKIDWNALECLQQDSRLIIYNHWYWPAFDVFFKRGIRVGILRHIDKTVILPCLSFCNQWIDCVYPFDRVYGDMIRLLYQRGCRRFMDAGVFLSDYNSRVTAFLETTKQLGVETRQLDLHGIASHSNQDVRNMVHSAWKEFRPDAILFDLPQATLAEAVDFYEYFNIPRTVKFVFHRDDSMYLRMKPQLSAFDFDSGGSGYRLAKLLMEESYRPCQFYGGMRFMDRESSGGPRVQPILREQKGAVVNDLPPRLSPDPVQY